MDIQKELFKLQDLKYKEFHASLMPTVSKDLVIGVRTPQLRKFAKSLPENEREEFIKKLPHKYYEENNLHIFLLEKIKDYDIAIAEIERFLPYIDNWATCDAMPPQIFKKNTDKLIDKIYEWLNSDKTYTVRYAIGLLLRFYLDDKFDVKYLERVSKIKSDEYYINMMIAWYFATALAKQYEESVKFIEEKRLDKWTHNKTIQKAVESNRLAKETKQYLKTLKITDKKL